MKNGAHKLVHITVDHDVIFDESEIIESILANTFSEESLLVYGRK